ncbi:MAG TPA: FHA domain-containing protein [Microbacteriaceae bacterium]
MTYLYSPGDWYAVAGGHSLVLVPETVSAELVAGAWHAVDSGGGFAAVLELLTGAYGTTLTAIPDFLVAEISDDMTRIIARGATQAVAANSDGSTVTVSGTGVTTWSEQAISAPQSVLITVGAVAPGDVAAGEMLALRAGVVRARTFMIARSAADVTTEPSTVVPVLAQPTPAPTLIEPAPVLAEPAPEPAPEPAGAEPTPEIVESMRAFAATAASAAAPTSTDMDETLAEVPYDTVGTGYDHLWGATVLNTVENAAVREEDDADLDAEIGAAATAASLPPVAAPPMAAPPVAAPYIAVPPVDSPSLIAGVPSFNSAAGQLLGGDVRGTVDDDHDGETVSIEQLRAMQAESATAVTLAGVAPSGGFGVQPGRAVSGILVLSTGEAIPLDTGAVLGRKPRVTRVQGGVLPRLVTVSSPNQDISRSHLEVQVEGDDILALDLGTTNGTRLLRPGKDPERLRAGEPIVLVNGDVLDLGDGVTGRIEGLT